MLDYELYTKDQRYRDEKRGAYVGPGANGHAYRIIGTSHIVRHNHDGSYTWIV